MFLQMLITILGYKITSSGNGTGMEEEGNPVTDVCHGTEGNEFFFDGYGK